MKAIGVHSLVLGLVLFGTSSLCGQTVTRVIPGYVLVDTDVGIGKIDQLTVVQRTTDEEVVNIGVVRLFTFNNGATVAKIVHEVEPFHVEVGDIVVSPGLLEDSENRETSQRNFTQEESETASDIESGRFGIGYGASMFGLWILDINIKKEITSAISVEALVGLGSGFGENGLNYEGAGIKGMYEFLTRNGLNLYGSATVWYLIGSKEPIHDFLAPKGNHSLGLTVGLGSEVWNGSFVELGFAAMANISSVSLSVGKRFYF